MHDRVGKEEAASVWRSAEGKGVTSKERLGGRRGGRMECSCCAWCESSSSSLLSLRWMGARSRIVKQYE